MASLTEVIEDVGESIEEGAKQFEREVIRPFAREFERIPYVGDLMRSQHEQRVAQRSMEATARESRRMRRQEQAAERSRLAARRRLTLAEQARAKRTLLAESLTNFEVGMLSSMGITPSDKSVNIIPSLDGMDEEGNLIPEV